MAKVRSAPQLTHSQGDIHRLLEQAGQSPRRALGQNFVADPNTVRRIAHLAEAGPQRPVVEIGAGLGSLTLALLETGAAVTAVEVDRDLVPVLRTVVEPLGARVVEADALTLDWDEVLAGQDDWQLVANLPYNVATPLVLDLLRDVPQIKSMLVMVQREVGERLAAEPGADSATGIPSVIVSYFANARMVGRVPASVFVPRPKVESALVAIERHREPVTATPLAAIEDLVRTGFGQRRKMLRKSLGAKVDKGQFALAEIDSSLRPDRLSLLDWARLAEAVGSGTQT